MDPTKAHLEWTRVVLENDTVTECFAMPLTAQILVRDAKTSASMSAVLHYGKGEMIP